MFDRALFTSLSLIWFLAGSDLRAEDPRPSISVSGSAEMRVVPDEVIINVAVESRAKTVGEATRDNDLKISQVIEFLKTSGVDAASVRTEFIGIESIMRPTPQIGQTAQKFLPNGNAPAAEAFDDERLLVPVGYKANRQLRITIKKLDTFETIYRGLIERGINKVSGIEFRTTELRKHRDEARKQAVLAAREKATAMAGELGATLLAVKSIRESSRDPFSSNRFANQNMIVSSGESDFEVGAIAAGQIQISATVDVEFYLGNSEMDE